MKLNDMLFKDFEKCFALVEENRGRTVKTSCSCLNKLYCKTKNCNFYKPKSEVSIRKMDADLRKYNTSNMKAGDNK